MATITHGPFAERVPIAGLTVGSIRRRFRDRYNLPGVTVHVDEGRSWLRRSDEKYDLIQMTGTDTYAALSSGSYVMSESYLYTAEAYDDFLGHLTPEGVIGVMRFCEFLQGCRRIARRVETQRDKTQWIPNLALHPVPDQGELVRDQRTGALTIGKDEIDNDNFVFQYVVEEAYRLTVLVDQFEIGEIVSRPFFFLFCRRRSR